MKHTLFFAIACLAAFYCGSAVAVPIEDIVSKRYTYESLSPYQKMLLEDFIEDEFPKGTKLADALHDRTSFRNKTRLAQALLFRDKQNDSENAMTVLRWILKYQYQDDSNKDYGMWRTSVAGDRHDQNWREFIGCDLIIIYKRYKNRLPADILQSIETGLTHAAKGAMKRNVRADYTNISIMSAFLMDFVGNEFKQTALAAAGLKKAKEITTLFNRYKTFGEYNSPTYYGVTLIGLALWRDMAGSAALSEMGTSLEREFWKEIAAFYNPNLQNMPAPYFRGYGMDMHKYYAITGLWIAAAVNDRALAPLPFGQGPKFGEISNISVIYHLGLVIPKHALQQLTQFTGPRYLERTVFYTRPGDSLKYVTAMIHKDWMMGGVWGNREAWNQMKTGAIHWKDNNSDIAWLLVPGDGNTNVKVSKATMKIYLANKEARQLQFFAYAKNIDVATFSDQSWELPGMVLKLNTSLKRIKTEAIDPVGFQTKQAVSDVLQSVISVVYEVPASWNSADPLIEIEPSKK